MSNFLIKAMCGVVAIFTLSADVDAKAVDFNTMMDHLVTTQLKSTSEHITLLARVSARNAVNQYGYSEQPTQVIIKDLQAQVKHNKVGFTAVTASK